MESVFTPTPSCVLTTSITKRKFFFAAVVGRGKFELSRKLGGPEKKRKGGKTPYYASFFASEVNSSPFLFRLPPPPDRSTEQKNKARRIPK